MRRLLALLHTVRGGSKADEATLNASTHVTRTRRLAEAHGFRRLGVLVEGFLTRPGFTCVVECWTDDQGVELHITDLFYLLQSQLEDGACELTWSIRTPFTESTRRMTSRPTAGSFAADLQAHREAVLNGRSAPWSHRTLTAQAEMSRCYQRRHVPIHLGLEATFGPALLLLWVLPFVPLLLLLRAGPVWLGACALALSLAPLLNPISRKRSRLLSRAREGGHADVPALVRAELGEALDAELERLDAKADA